MRWRDLVVEAGRNIGSGTTRAFTAALALLAILLGLVLPDVLTCWRILSQQRAVVEGGGATFIIAADDQIDAVRCLALRDLRGVVGVMAVRDPQDRLPLLAQPHTSPPRYEAVGDITGVLGGTRMAATGIWISEELRAQLGTGPLPLADGRDAQVAGTFPYPNDGRHSQFATAVLEPTQPSGSFDSCWLTVWPYDAASVSLLDTALTPEAEGVTRTTLNPTFGEPQSTADLLRIRTTMAMPFGAIAAAIGLGVVMVWIRRVELALALHLGVSVGAQRRQLLVEAGCWTLPAACFAAATMSLLSSMDTPAEEAHWLVSYIIITSFTVSAMAMVGTYVGSAVIREHRLYRWAKER